MNILSDLSITGRLSNIDHIEYNSFWKESLLNIAGLPFFADNQYENVSWNQDMNQFYGNRPLYNVNNWTIESNHIFYEKYDENDKSPLTMLYFIITNFILPRGFSIRGKVVIYTKTRDIYKVVSYDINDSEFTYKVNESIELTRHWKNCCLFYTGHIIKDEHYPRCSLELDSNPFKNFILNFSLFNPEDFSPEEIFEDTFNNLI